MSASLRKLLPLCINVSERRDDRDHEPLYSQEWDYLAPAVSRRKAEFLTSRCCAREVLAALGLDRPPMIPGPAGAPRWPDGVVGSITHCEGYRAAVAAWAREVWAVGVDAEPAKSLPPGVLEVVALDAEIDRLAVLSSTNPDLPWDRLLFSVKESVYKVWFPLARTWLDFEDADVRLDRSGRFTAVLAQPLLVPGGEAVNELSGRWATDGRHVLSALALLDPTVPVGELVP
ncbi:4'-phosphopantetheinyl transferase family protein [Actinomyces sp. Marseille-P3109]|uniref:4'-phosphopantetheinyl transferase family protein n=1 Tax=Actinomyces sp. Marseille-P3109 TaxID=2083009 RepID=UPI000D557A85|nr:4'-phosphopantetheinyl transferase superfamily protein [Actinomyces sp. Marseille-P3109]